MGWVVGPAKTIEQLWGYHDYTSIGPTMLTDRLASIALEPARRAWILNRTREILNKNYPPLKAWLDAHSDILSHVPPKPAPSPGRACATDAAPRACSTK